MMTAMIKPSDSHSDSEDSDSSHPSPSTSQTRSSNYQPIIKSKLLRLKNENIIHRSSPTKPLSTPHICPAYPISNTPPELENCSPPPPNYNLPVNPHNKFFPRHSQSPPSSSLPYFHNYLFADDANCDNSSNDSPIHNV